MAAGGPSINFIDLLIGGVILYGCFKGYSDGVEKPIQRAAIVVAALCGIKFYSYLDEFLLNNFEVPPSLAPYLSGLLIFGGVFFILHFLLSGFSGYVGKVSPVPNSVGKAVGVVWGALKTSLIISFATLFLSSVNLPPANMIGNSVLYPKVRDFGMNVVSSLFTEIPLIQKMIGEVGRVIKPANNDLPVTPAPDDPVVKNTPSVTVTPPDNERKTTERNATPAPPANEKDREVRLDRNTGVYTPDYPKSEIAKETEPVKPKVVKPKGSSKPPTVR